MNGKGTTEGFTIDFKLFISRDVFGKQRAVVSALERVAWRIPEKKESYLEQTELSPVIDF